MVFKCYASGGGECTKKIAKKIFFSFSLVKVKTIYCETYVKTKIFKKLKKNMKNFNKKKKIKLLNIFFFNFFISRFWRQLLNLSWGGQLATKTL